MARILVIRNWSEFQHYKDRDPPWIKLYRDTLTSEVWVLGTDVSRLVQLASTLLAARYKNKTPLNFELWREVSKIRCSETEFFDAIRHLCKWKFASVQELEDEDEPNASDMLATCATSSGVLYSEGEQSRGRAEGEQSQTRARVASTLLAVPHGTSGTAKGSEDSAIEISNDDAFEQVALLKAKYPPGAATENWITGERAARRLVENGEATWGDLHAGVERMARNKRATGDRVMDPARFFTHEARYWSQPWTVPKTRAEAAQSGNVDAAVEWLRQQGVA